MSATTTTVSQTTGTDTPTAPVAVLHRDGAGIVLSAALDLARHAAVPASAVADLVEASVAADAESPLRAVREAQARLLTGLARNPFFDAEGVRASRLLFAAADTLTTAAAPAAPLATAA